MTLCCFFPLLFQFLLVFRKAAAGELAEDSGLSRLAALTNVDVGQVGVTGAANFFESKVRLQCLMDRNCLVAMFTSGQC